MQMYKERLKYKAALYELSDIRKNHPSCAACSCADYCDLVEKYGVNTAVRIIEEAALYKLSDICKNHPSCAACYCADYCDLVEKYGVNTAVRIIEEKENGDE